MSDYYSVGSVGTRNTTARAETVQAQLQAVDDGFALLPDKLPLQQDRIAYSADTGSANTYVVTLAKVPPAYVEGMRVTFKAATANTGASTIDVNGLGTKSLRMFDGSALSAGVVTVGLFVVAVYDGTLFRIVSMHGGTDIASLAAIAADISTVSGISSNVTAVAADATDIGTVSANIADVSAVAAIDTAVSLVAAVDGETVTVAGIAANVSTVAGISANVTTVAGISAAVSTVAADGADIGTVSTNIASVNTCATNIADIIANAAGFVTKSGSTMSGELIMADQLLTRPILKDFGLEVSAIGNVGATRTFDIVNGNYFTATVDQASTFTFSNPTATGDACVFYIQITNGGAFVVTWPGAVAWDAATAPTLQASGVDIIAFVTTDAGTAWRGFPVWQAA